MADALLRRLGEAPDACEVNVVLLAAFWLCVAYLGGSEKSAFDSEDYSGSNPLAWMFLSISSSAGVSL